MIIESSTDYDHCLEAIKDHRLIVEVVPSQIDAHPVLCKPLALFIYDTVDKQIYTIPFDHPDVDYKVDITAFMGHLATHNPSIWTLNKKNLIHILPLQNVYDIGLLYYMQEGNPLVVDNNGRMPIYDHYAKHRSFIETGKLVPLLKHKESFMRSLPFLIDGLNKCGDPDKAFLRTNDIVVETLATIERNGLAVEDKIFKKYFHKAPKPISGITQTQYNLLTPVGRPSNHYGGVNYAALKREDGCRASFISRHGKDGKLILLDYSAFHPRIICYLTNFDLPLETDIYRYLAEIFFNRTNLTSVDIEEAKRLTFRQLYGGVEPRFEHIKYFYRLRGYVNDLWCRFQKDGYVETPIFSRKITDGHILDANPNKLFNYLLQATETELAIPIVSKINAFLTNKKSKVVLYTYDSILIDFHKNDGKQTLLDVLEIMRIKNRFPIKAYAGDNYNNMSLLRLA
jgi:hypothetical protein